MILLTISISDARSQQIETSSMCEGKEINSFVPDPENCSKFFQCNGDTFIHGSCPTGMFYHQQDVCSFDDSDCSSSTEPPTTSSSSSTTDETNVTSSTGIPEKSTTTAASTDPGQRCADVDPNRPHFIKSPTQCSEYYICVDGKAIPGQCPDNMLFNAEMEYCDFPDNVDCGTLPRPPGFEQASEATTPQEATTTTIPEASEAPGESCPAVDDPVVPTYLAVFDDCSSYILCYHGNPLKMKCPIGLEWNRQDSMCDTPQNAKCQVH
ncbi:peritrophin-1-like [Anopheles ziemanni]|uniref:peritrophin-1-like n=1 Tax=Anopheles coustani TaxID=139045 RepID=UPI0026598693|nr:peritrophin-1-like [Anopheles coustani]XP_058169972.1 peritrophin-1-like [Anopheles ziemanni]